jgi:hypothetical protein
VVTPSAGGHMSTPTPSVSVKRPVLQVGEPDRRVPGGVSSPSGTLVTQPAPA